MIGSLWVGRQGAPSKVGFDHVGDDGTRLGEVEGGEGRIHLVETFAAASVRFEIRRRLQPIVKVSVPSAEKQHSRKRPSCYP
jgi:hypothetical protein